MLNLWLYGGAAARAIGPVTSLSVLLLSAAGDATVESSWVGPLAVAEVVAGDQLSLEDGRVVRLAGIRVPSDDAGALAARSFAAQARDELSRLLDDRSIRVALAAVAHDRYGRVVAQVERSDGLWLQGALLERGLAQVHTRPGEVARAGPMLAIERAARAARRGLWATAAFTVHDASVVTGDGEFRIVDGRVLRVAPTESFVYLNFGADWRRDFTVRIANDIARRLVDSGLDVTTLAGRRIEIRGFVLDAGGPLIELSHAEQMQILP